MRIGIVNDSPLAVQVLKYILLERSSHKVAWVAENGMQAVTYCRQDPPELVLMDLVMPLMNGVEATRLIMEEQAIPILIVTASVDSNSPMIFEAMGYGARDAVHTPVLTSSTGRGSADRLLRKIGMFEKLFPSSKELRINEPCPVRNQSTVPVLIGASTGGPKALTEILSQLPANLSAGIAIAQHVDAGFASNLAKWLAQQTPLKVRLAQTGDCLEPGIVNLAATQDHLVVNTHQRLSYVKEPEDKPYRPSVDVLFESAALHCKRRGIAIVLTGMGMDGAKGLLRLKQKGWTTWVQDAESCAVYGMPKACVELGAATAQIPIERMAMELENMVYSISESYTEP